MAETTTEDRFVDVQPMRAPSTRCARLMADTIKTVGEPALANSLQIPVETLRAFASGDTPITLNQQRLVAAAVLVLCEQSGGLRRSAANLLSQLGAAQQYAHGDTVRSTEDPRERHHWRI